MSKQQDNRKNSRTLCSFCGQAGSRADALIEGPNKVFICPDCVELCHNIIRQNRRQQTGRSMGVKRIPMPREIREYLDEYVVGQDRAKRYLSVAVHN
nr:ATP-dependent Clp protease ATP-binding subunit ClpX [Phycisphaerae bacterium]